MLEDNITSSHHFTIFIISADHLSFTSYYIIISALHQLTSSIYSMPISSPPQNYDLDPSGTSGVYHLSHACLGYPSDLSTSLYFYLSFITSYYHNINQSINNTYVSIRHTSRPRCDDRRRRLASHLSIFDPQYYYYWSRSHREYIPSRSAMLW
jgi:hypothetical protein